MPVKAARRTGAYCASDQKKCAILAMVNALDQRYTGICDECCAMLRAVAKTGFLITRISWI
ncbi:hypothetical protein CJU81_15345 [Pseudomonas fragi]|uniref:Uncharacterized protein n=1 Tax=Pseudomonas fragi TaxID=296 RepID=A0A267ACX4_PSEFR|nr:hypothetical protein CJU81_15345 [Pseudomonas fragi]